jgi:RNA polymerase sigma-70 factor (ECF subfamily)
MAARMDGRSDEQLMAAVQTGDMDALGALVERFQQPLTSYLDRLVGPDWALAQDLTQETFLRVLSQRALRLDQPFKPWLYAVATNLARDHFRSSRVRRGVRLDDEQAASLSDDVAGPEDYALATERSERIVWALRRLGPEYRETVLLRFYCDLTLPEVAATLEVPLGTVKSRLWAGLQRLRTLLPAPEPQAAREGGDRG